MKSAMKKMAERVMRAVRGEVAGELAALLLILAAFVAHFILVRGFGLGLFGLAGVLTEVFRLQSDILLLVALVVYLTAFVASILVLLRLCRGEREWDNLFLARELAKLQPDQMPRPWYRRLFSELPFEALRDWRAGSKARASVA